MLANILLLLINAAGGFLTLMLLARFYMQWQRISFRNQLGQFVVSTTDWIVRPLRRFVPGLFGLDMASLLPAWVVQILLVAFELGLRGAVFSGNTAAVIGGLGGVGLIELLRMMVYLLFAVVLGSAVLSWVAPHAPLAPLFNAIAAPF
ncbi:MAG: YggT family protein, partial [Thauera sp.]